MDDGFEFRPYNPVLRQHFAKMIVLTLGVPVSEEDVCPFDDVDYSGPDELYPDNYVAAAYFADITNGGLHVGFNDPTHGYNAQLAEWNGLLAGIDLYGWDVWEPATRREVAQILWNATGLLPGE